MQKPLPVHAAIFQYCAYLKRTLHCLHDYAHRVTLELDHLQAHLSTRVYQDPLG